MRATRHHSDRAPNVTNFCHLNIESKHNTTRATLWRSQLFEEICLFICYSPKYYHAHSGFIPATYEIVTLQINNIWNYFFERLRVQYLNFIMFFFVVNQTFFSFLVYYCYCILYTNSPKYFLH